MNKIVTTVIVAGVIVALATFLMRRGIGSGGLTDAGSLIT